MDRPIRTSAKIVTNGGMPPQRQVTPPKRPVVWYLILMSHSDRGVRYRAGTKDSPKYRGVQSTTQAEALIKRGLIAAEPSDPRLVVPNKDHIEHSDHEGTPLIASPPDTRKRSVVSQMLDDARKTVWTPTTGGKK